ncbi:hypothetical protein GOP47_0000290 [Adiantum capillus-veneris]|uniref:Uncharacterized protein n=1 Tax=Adiantum capillus-veneris TaxID=13818 RepID=A0A9D4VCR5_ADICA|nr:hypothetical protein GOP47_0000290 [Adiantum capillus-veneris]
MLVALLLLLRQQQLASGSTVGVAYGRNGNNLPSPSEVVSLLKSKSINNVRIYDASSDVLSAFQNSGVSLIVGVPNPDLQSVSTSSGASSWVQTNIIPYASASSISGIAVGNEVLTRDTQYTQYLYPAMTNIYDALKSNNLDTSIFVSTTHAFDVIDSQHPYPPSSGQFAPSLQSEMSSILAFLSQHGGPFLAHVYPYFAYTSGGGTIPLSYALFQPGTDNVDSGSGLHYTNLFDAQVDTLIAAMGAMGYNNIQLVVTESGWPHQGDTAATISNAQTYNTNLVAHVPNGTPKHPNTLVSTYIFSLFDENEKSSGIEQHFGVFNPDQSMVYDLTF